MFKRIGRTGLFGLATAGTVAFKYSNEHMLRQRAENMWSMTSEALVAQCEGPLPTPKFSGGDTKSPSTDDILNFVAELSMELESDQIEVDVGECEARGKPWNSYHQIERIPFVIVTPNTTEETSMVVRLCHKYNIPIVPFGGGTSLEGQTLTPYGGCSLDFNRMKSIIQINEVDLDVTVQAGIGYIELNDILKKKGVPLWFPLTQGLEQALGECVLRVVLGPQL